MPDRAFSPARSENEFDISTALLADKDDSGSETGNGSKGAFNGLVGPDEDDDDDEDFIVAAQAASNRKGANLKGKSVKKGGGFQAMGLNANLLKAITRKGYTAPTPIQRRAIPLVLAGQDVVAMARTGSGKTAAFLIPLIQKLKQHSAQVGARGLILSPSRELALQTLKVVKELCRNTDLKSALLVGGDSIEEQFGMMSSNPDVIIATPGRFMHVQVEMKLDLSSMRYVCFDEADRLFENGFGVQLNEILHALPPSRQTMLFSATLPSTLVEFAKAGLQEPKLIRLDSESKISPDLQSAFFPVKSADKEGALLYMLQTLLQIPTGPTKLAQEAKAVVSKGSKKRKRTEVETKANESPAEHSTIVFTATKHHVEFLVALLKSAGYISVSFVYSSLDQVARRSQITDFRTGMSNILVVTDVAARGLDIPVLANVINYDFPGKPKLYLHRVGRVARAGQRGFSFSLVKESDAPYLMDLQLFLAQPLKIGRVQGENASLNDNVIVGTLPRDGLSASCEWASKLMDDNSDLTNLRSVAEKGEKLYQRTRSSASTESAKRAKQISTSKEWTELHSLFKDENHNAEIEREDMLARISGFRPPETVFEIGRQGSQNEIAGIVQKRRETLEKKKQKDKEAKEIGLKEDTIEDEFLIRNQGPAQTMDDFEDAASLSDASSAELEITFNNPSSTSSKKGTLKDSENYMSYTPSHSNPHEDAAYGVHSGSTTNSRNPSFLTAARSATLDLNADEATAFGEPPRPSMRWDKRHKKYISTSSFGPDGKKDKGRGKDETGKKKWVKSESGGRIAASFRSGRFERWKKANKIERLPRVGEKENPAVTRRLGGESGDGPGRGGMGGKRYRHRKEEAPKEADKYRDDFEVRRKRVAEAKEKRVGRFRDGGGKKEVRGAEEMGRERAAKARRREKTGRHKGKVTGGKGRGRGRR